MKCLLRWTPWGASSPIPSNQSHVHFVGCVEVALACRVEIPAVALQLRSRRHQGALATGSAQHLRCFLNQAPSNSGPRSLICCGLKRSPAGGLIRWTSCCSGLLHTAAAAGEEEEVRQLLATAPHLAASPDADGALPLHGAANAGSVEAVRLLLAAAPATAGAADTKGFTPVHRAAQAGSEGVVRLLLEAAPATAAAVDARGFTPLHRAALAGSEGVVRLLLAAAPSTATALMEGDYTPLHLASHKGHEGVVRLLLEAAPATAVAVDTEGSTPLHEAAYAGSAGAARLLLAAAPATAAARRGPYGITPLALALLRGDIGLARCILNGVTSAQPSLQQLARAAVSSAKTTVQTEDVQALIAVLAARLPLSEADWALVPAGCRGLGQALPAVWKRSVVEAGQLVTRLSAHDRRRLRTLALSLARAWPAGLERPAEISGRILAHFACSL